jgi:hypothetical protein
MGIPFISLHFRQNKSLILRFPCQKLTNIIKYVNEVATFAAQIETDD